MPQLSSLLPSFAISPYYRAAGVQDTIELPPVFLFLSVHHETSFFLS